MKKDNSSQGALAGADAATGAPTPAAFTPGPWKVFNMVHSDHGGPMSADELGEYVAGSVRKTRAEGGSDDFLFVTTAYENGPDICHIGNGPRGPHNGMLIAQAPAMLALLREVREGFLIADDDGITVTIEPIYSYELFDRLCAVISAADGGEAVHAPTDATATA